MTTMSDLQAKAFIDAIANYVVPLISLGRVEANLRNAKSSHLDAVKGTSDDYQILRQLHDEIVRFTGNSTYLNENRKVNLPEGVESKNLVKNLCAIISQVPPSASSKGLTSGGLMAQDAQQRNIKSAFEGIVSEYKKATTQFDGLDQNSLKAVIAGNKTWEIKSPSSAGLQAAGSRQQAASEAPERLDSKTSGSFSISIPTVSSNPKTRPD